MKNESNLLCEALMKEDDLTISLRIEESKRKKSLDLPRLARDGFTPLTYCVFYEDIDGMLLLLDAGADVNALDGQGMPPLFHALNNDNLDTADVLFEYGADVNVKSKEGQDALFSNDTRVYASRNIEYLKAKGINIS